MKRKLLWRLFTMLGINECELLPWYGRAIYCALFPSVILRMYAAKVYDPLSDVFTIHGQKVSGCFFRHIWLEPTPTRWSRFIKREDGMVTIECKQEGGAK